VTRRGSVGDVEAWGGVGGAQYNGSRPDVWSGDIGPEEGDDPGGPVLRRKAAKAIRPNSRNELEGPIETVF
jgi:hypothetical protein